MDFENAQDSSQSEESNMSMEELQDSNQSEKAEKSNQAEEAEEFNQAEEAEEFNQSEESEGSPSSALTGQDSHESGVFELRDEAEILQPLELQNSIYFRSYGDLAVHRTLLLDESRVITYQKAVFRTSVSFEGKVVLDVGAGLGFLSILCALADAKKVYAVEASDRLIPLLHQVIKDNNCEDVIEVIHGEVEKIDLKEKVDIIISEWMGFYLLHEGMLDSVISARRFLKSDGVIFPSKATMYVALCDVPMLATKWSEVSGINFIAAVAEYRAEVAHQPLIEQLDVMDVMSDAKVFATFDLHNVTSEFLQEIVMRTIFAVNKIGTVEGICIWWEVGFLDSFILSTSPNARETHWKQTVILFPTPIIVEPGLPVAVEIILKKSTPRRYSISLELLDPDEEEHAIPCECYSDRCVVVKAFLAENKGPEAEEEEEGRDQ